LVERKKNIFLSHQPSIFQEHAAQRCQSRKPKGCGNGAALRASEAALENRLGKGFDFSFQPSIPEAFIEEWGEKEEVKHIAIF